VCVTLLRCFKRCAVRVLMLADKLSPTATGSQADMGMVEWCEKLTAGPRRALMPLGLYGPCSFISGARPCREQSAIRASLCSRSRRHRAFGHPIVAFPGMYWHHQDD
jgi:hypothetical protein